MSHGKKNGKYYLLLCKEAFLTAIKQGKTSQVQEASSKICWSWQDGKLGDCGAPYMFVGYKCSNNTDYYCRHKDQEGIRFKGHDIVKIYALPEIGDWTQSLCHHAWEP